MVRAGLSEDGLSWLRVASATAVHVKAGAGAVHHENKSPLVGKAEKCAVKGMKR